MPRPYKCIGVKENTNFFWRQGFTIGDEYEEADVDPQDENWVDDDTLLLFDRSNLRVYVDRNQFEEIILVIKLIKIIDTIQVTHQKITKIIKELKRNDPKRTI